MRDNMFEDGSLDAISAFSPIGPTTLVQPTLASGRSATAVVPDAGHTLQGSWRDGSLRKGLYRNIGKRVADVIFVLLSLPIILPVTLLCALALWIEGGQPFYRQQRLGKGGRQFSILKLRTMCCDADEVLESTLAADPAMRAEWDHAQKLKNDPRITRVGAILRKTSLDEVPQFWNVLKGEMSVVGPRPMMPEQLAMYDNPQPYFDLRPGITGEWQVSDRNESSFAHRSTIDGHYHARLSFPTDLRILFQTIGVVLRRTGY